MVSVYCGIGTGLPYIIFVTFCVLKLCLFLIIVLSSTVECCIAPYTAPLFEMTLEDPFYVVKDEVFKALNKTRGLFLRWMEITKSPNMSHTPETDWTSTELRNSLRSIEWDLEDLEDTISIVEKNSSKFKIDSKEICERRTFIEATKKEVEFMKEKVIRNRNQSLDGTPVPTSTVQSPKKLFCDFWASTPKMYTRLENQVENPFNRCSEDFISRQEEMLMNQECQTDMFSTSAAFQMSASEQIGAELDEQTTMLDDVNTVLENTSSTVNTNLKKLKNVLKINNDRRQWVMITILLALLFIILLLFITI